MLTVKNAVENIHIHDVYGTYYQYGIGFTKYYEGECTGYYAGITIDNIFVSKAERLSLYCKDGLYVFPLIWVESDLVVRDLSVSNVRRRETNTPVETFHVGENTCVENLSLSHIFTGNETPDEMPLMMNRGKIKSFRFAQLKFGKDPAVVNHGTMEKQSSVDEKW